MPRATRCYLPLPPTNRTRYLGPLFLLPSPLFLPLSPFRRGALSRRRRTLFSPAFSSRLTIVDRARFPSPSLRAYRRGHARTSLVCSWRLVRACVYPRARSRFDMAKLRARDVFIDQIQQAVPRYAYLRAPVLSPAKLTESGRQRSLLLTDRPTVRPIDGAKVFRRKAAICGGKSCRRSPVRPRGSAVNHGTAGA